MGVTSPLFGFREFCGDDCFCANVDFFGNRGLHIPLDEKDVALGKADTKYGCSGETAESVYDRMGTANARLSVLSWEQCAEVQMNDIVSCFVQVDLQMLSRISRNRPKTTLVW